MFDDRSSIGVRRCQDNACVGNSDIRSICHPLKDSLYIEQTLFKNANTQQIIPLHTINMHPSLHYETKVCLPTDTFPPHAVAVLLPVPKYQTLTQYPPLTPFLLIQGLQPQPSLSFLLPSPSPKSAPNSDKTQPLKWPVSYSSLSTHANSNEDF